MPRLLTLLEILLRVALLLGCLTALGSGLTRLLPADLDRGVRWAITPALGLAAAACLLTTALWFMPAKVAAWVVLLPAMVLSVAIAVIGARRAAGGVRAWLPGRRGLIQGGIIAVVGLAALTAPMVINGSLGPYGYMIADAGGYMGEVVGAHDLSIREADALTPEALPGETPTQTLARQVREDPRALGDLSLAQWSGAAGGYQQLGFDAVLASVSALGRLPAATTMTPFWVALLLAGALGCFACVRQLTGTRAWPAVLAGCLFCGPLVQPPMMEGSQALISGLAVIPAFLLVGWLALSQRRLSDAILLGVVAGGLQTLYPLFVPIAALAGVLALGGGALWWVATQGVQTIPVGRVALGIGIVVVVTLAITPVATVDNFNYWKTLFTTSYLEDLATAGLPTYDLPTPVLPSWLLQTREFYFLTGSTERSLQQWVLGDIAPLFLLGLIAYGVVRYPRMLVPVAFAAAAGVAAWYALRTNNCSYCVQRNLLSVAPAASILLSVGILALWVHRERWWRAAAIGVTLAVVVMAGHKSTVLARRAADGVWMTPAQLRAMSGDLKKLQNGTILLELGQDLDAATALPVSYHTVNAATDARLALPAELSDFGGLIYLGGPREPRPSRTTWPLEGEQRGGFEFTPRYRWILTRVPDIQTDRRTLVRRGPYALQERTSPFDVSIVGGVVADRTVRDTSGRAFLAGGPMTFWVASTSPERAWLDVTVDGARPRLVKPKSAEILEQTPRRLRLCVPVAGTGTSLRRVRVEVAHRDVAPPPAEPLALRGSPNQGAWLQAMRVRTSPCS